MESNTTKGIGISSIFLMWGVITQCLQWGGVLNWPWYAIWGPVLFIVAVWVLAIIVVIVMTLILRR